VANLFATASRKKYHSLDQSKAGTMRRFIAAVTGILFCVHIASAADTIPDVKTLADLRKLPAIRTVSGYDVRVGMADPGTDAGPYRVVYCLAKRTADVHDSGLNFKGTHVLGPLSVDVVNPKFAEIKKAARVAKRSAEPDEQLFVGQIPIAATDNAVMRVYDGDEALLERDLGKAGHRPMFWSAFVHRAASKAKPSVADPNPWPACPGSYNAGSISLDVTPSTTTRPLIPEDAPLPGSDMIAPEWRQFLYPAAKGELITLSLEKDSFVLNSDGPLLVESPTDELLARWWVNGKPIECPDNNVPQASQQMRAELQPKATMHSKIAFDLPKMLGPLNPGDRIGLQLVWSGSTQRVSRQRQQAMLMAGRVIIDPVPIPTNRLDFTVDDQLLSLRSQ
jgi:hypothetical protein